MLAMILIAVIAAYVGMPSAFWLAYGACATLKLLINISNMKDKQEKEKENKR